MGRKERWFKTHRDIKQVSKNPRLFPKSRGFFVLVRMWGSTGAEGEEAQIVGWVIGTQPNAA
jgi:hypothetical protein